MIQSPQTRVSKRVMFCAAHSLPDAGTCSRIHGHNWVANITVDLIGGSLDKRGFIVDVRELKEAAFKYDHDNLNDYFEIASTELVAAKIAEDALNICKESNPKGIFIVNVNLAETENNTASSSATNFVGFQPDEIGLTPLSEQMKHAHDAEASWMFGGQDSPQPKSKFIKRS